jgi:hypothetical protein
VAVIVSTGAEGQSLSSRNSSVSVANLGTWGTSRDFFLDFVNKPNIEQTSERLTEWRVSLIKGKEATGRQAGLRASSAVAVVSAWQ